MFQSSAVYGIVVCSRTFFILSLVLNLDLGLVDVAPAPVFTGLEGLDDGVRRFMKMLSCVFVGRAVAAADVSAGEAKAEVYPLGADLETVFASSGGRSDVVNLGEVMAGHEVLVYKIIR
jgi:hypothetical protein